MGWKDLSLSIKLAMIFLIVPGLALLFANLTDLSFLWGIVIWVFFVTLYPFALLFVRIFGDPLIIKDTGFGGFPNFVGFIIAFLIYFFIGLLIGRFIQKRKS